MKLTLKIKESYNIYFLILTGATLCRFYLCYVNYYALVKLGREEHAYGIVWLCELVESKLFFFSY